MNEKLFFNTYNASKKKYKKSLRTNRNVIFSVNSVSNLFNELEHILDTVKSDPENSFDCRNGCTHCCSLRVEVLPPEVFYIAKKITEDFPDNIGTIITNLEKQATYAADKTKEDYNYPCEFLVNNSCSIYKHRPFMCRKLLSYDVEKCKDEKREPPESIELISKSLGLGSGFSDAYSDIKLNAEPVEFSQALLKALTDKTLLKKWYGRENVFKTLP